MKCWVSNTRIYIVHLAIIYEIKIQERCQKECTLRFICITYFFHSDSIVSVRSKRAVRAGRTEHLTRLQFLSCVGTRCSLLESVYHIVITLVSRLNSSERKPLCSCRLLLSAVLVPEIADTSSGALVVCIINIRSLCRVNANTDICFQRTRTV